ncbi:hypothetical protein [Frankia sp. R43]|uniref:hypothetical protein n=1 Tax=Frankia sp. R43 TaxID=269536 RepID=UPI00128F2597|nr:hypothetical protein [Frankia sp. R43]
MKRRARSSVAVSSLGIALLAGPLLAGCGSGGEEGTVTAASVAQSGDPDAPCTKVDVQARLAEMRASKRDLLATPPAAPGQPDIQIGNPGDYAYASLPIDLTGPGRYTLKFGPVDEGFDYPRIQKSVAFLPADDFAAQVETAHTTEMITDPDGKRYLKVDVTIKNIDPCTSFVMFIA